MTFKEFNLSQNPFELIGRSLTSEVPVFWAGMKTQREQIENIYINANKPRNLILNWGPFGTGKTHAAFYFKNQSIHVKQNVEFITLYVKTPLEGSNGIKQLLKDIIDDISFTKLKEIIKARIAELGESKLFNLINSTIKSDVYASALIKLGDCEPKLTEFMYRYVYGNVTRTELKQFHLPRALNTEVDYLKFLAGLIVCLTSGNNILTKVVLWIDELENLLYYTSKQFKRLTQGIITLVDTNENLLVFMNYTLNDDIDTLKILIGDRLWSRINQKIEFTELSMEKGLEYCHDLITHYQFEPSTDYFPFEKDSLKVILNTLHTPYDINKTCSDILYYSLENQVKKITKEKVVSFLNPSLNHSFR